MKRVSDEVYEQEIQERNAKTPGLGGKERAVETKGAITNQKLIQVIEEKINHATRYAATLAEFGKDDDAAQWQQRAETFRKASVLIREALLDN